LSLEKKNKERKDLPPKAYSNKDFLMSRDARTIRILAEFLEPMSRFRRLKVKDTIVFFGSARIKSEATARKELTALVKANAPVAKINHANAVLGMSRYYEDTAELSYRLTKWSMKLKPNKRFVICSGGGPGIMEAANLGARRANGITVGLNISLPMEQYPNDYVTEDLSFVFHYFFMRKFWFAYLAKALVIMPGGFGTLDELFELLTLLQTKKIKKKMPIVIYDKKYWHEILNLDELCRRGMISRKDLNLFHFVDTTDEAFEYLKEELSRDYLHLEASLFNHKNYQK
jgi:uncharacterized protein (TIGR00730 family)